MSESKRTDEIEDRLRKDHEDLINKALTKVNDVSEMINEKDKEFSYLTKKLNNYANYVDEELKNVEPPVNRAVLKTQSYFTHRRYQKELKIIVERITSAIRGFSDNHEELLHTLSFMEKNHNSQKNATNEADLSKIDLLTQEINDLEQNRNVQEQYLKSIIETMATIEKVCASEEKHLQKSLNLAQKYYDYKDELMKGIIEHQDQIMVVEKEIAKLKAEYTEAMEDLNKLSMKIHEDNENERQKIQAISIESSNSTVFSNDPHANTRLNDKIALVPYAQPASGDENKEIQPD